MRDLLIQNALKKGQPLIPLYCLFIQTDDKNYFNHYTALSSSEKSLYGCSLTSAFTVKQLRAKKKKHLSDLEAHLIPWHWLVCYKRYSGSDFLSNIQDYAKQYFNLDKGIAKELGVNIPEDFITRKPPQYVISILENEDNDNVEAPDKEIDGVIIISERKQLPKKNC